MSMTDDQWKDLKAKADASTITQKVVRPTTHPSENSNPPSPEAKNNGLTTGLLLAVPLLAALAAGSVPYVLTLADTPLAWLGGIAVAAVAVTALAAAAESAPRRDVARVMWPLLLVWPLAFPHYMATRNRGGLVPHPLTGLFGTILLCGALGWAVYQVNQGKKAAAELQQILDEQIAGKTPSEARDKDGLTENERQRILIERMERMLDAEDGK